MSMHYHSSRLLETSNVLPRETPIIKQITEHLQESHRISFQSDLQSNSVNSRKKGKIKVAPDEDLNTLEHSAIKPSVSETKRASSELLVNPTAKQSIRPLPSKPDQTHSSVSVLEWDIAEKGATLINSFTDSPIGGDNAAKSTTSGTSMVVHNDSKALVVRRDVSAGLHNRTHLPNPGPDSSLMYSSQENSGESSTRNPSASEVNYKYRFSGSYYGNSHPRREIKHYSGKQRDRYDSCSTFGSARCRDGRADYPLPTDVRSFWIVNVYGQSRKVSHKHVAYHKQSTLLGLLQNSLIPLTDQLPAAKIELIEHQAAKFCGAFVSTAQWYINIDNLPPHVGALIGGVTTESRQTDIRSRFMRFRFPHIFFEVSIINPLMPSEITPGNKSSIAMWRAWAKGGANLGLVAYGKVYDEISADWRISRRYFEVIQVFQPEIFRPVPYPRDPAISAGYISL